MRFISWRAGRRGRAGGSSFRCVVRNGIRRVQIADPSNDPDDLAQHGARSRAREGVEEVVIGLTYSISPVHTDAYYAERAAAIGRCARHRPPLPEGPRRARRPSTRCASWRRCSSRRSRRGRSSCTATARSGSRRMTYMEGCAARLRHAAHRGRAGRQRHVATRRPRRRCATSRRAGYAHGARPRGARARCRSTSAALALDSGCRSARPPSTTPRTTATRCPAAWSRRRAASSRRCAGPSCSTPRWRRSARVRAEMGYPIMVTPVSQFVVTQAVMNVMGGERCASVSDDVDALLPRPLRRRRRRRRTPRSPTACSRCRARPSCATWSRSASRARASASARGISDEELLLRLTMPAEQVDAMVAAAAPAPPLARPGRDPLVRLLRGAGQARRRSRTCAWRRATTWWCGAVRLDDVRGFVFDVDGSLVHRGPDGRAEPLPGRGRGAGGDPRVRPAAGAVHERQPHGARGVRRAACARTGCRSATSEMLTPVCSALSYLRAPARGRARCWCSAQDAVRERMVAEGVPLVDGRATRRRRVRRARRRRSTSTRWSARRARSSRGARLLTANYLRGVLRARTA